MGDALHEHFNNNRDQWLKNPHISACYTTHHDVPKEKQAKRDQYFKDTHHIGSKEPIVHGDFLYHDKYCIFLVVDEENDASVLEIKKAIEAAGHPVFLEHQTELPKLQNYALEYDSGLGRDIPNSANHQVVTVSATVKKGDIHYILTVGHIGPRGTQLRFVTDINKKPVECSPQHIATIEEVVSTTTVDAALAKIDVALTLCPREINGAEIQGVYAGAPLKVGDPVHFYGAKSGVQEVKIHSINYSGDFENEEGTKHKYTDLLQMELKKKSSGGDCGGIYFYLKDGLHMAAMHIGGKDEDSNKFYSYATPLGPVFKALNLTDHDLIWQGQEQTPAPPHPTGKAPAKAPAGGRKLPPQKAPPAKAAPGHALPPPPGHPATQP